MLLINIHIIKYDIHCIIHYYNYSFPRIYVYIRYLHKSCSIVEPFMYISMIYKLGKNKEN